PRYLLIHTLTHSTTSYFFFLTYRPPPKSTLFPYTTLFRSIHIEVTNISIHALANMVRKPANGQYVTRSEQRQPVFSGQALARHRSEEHTSELQSRGHLVCRLLLEKKKKTNIISKILNNIKG